MGGDHQGNHSEEPELKDWLFDCLKDAVWIRWLDLIEHGCILGELSSGKNTIPNLL
jgi:hypothetical protein